ncbi:MAG: metallopeptidase TldD-related protein [bacterium]
MSRQGNLIVRSSRTVSFPELRTQLIEECKRQGKPYGLMFEDISGGYTMMARWTPQAFKVIPLLVYRVYADGRPDEVVRGVDIVGTPLTCFAKIINAADDDDIFNGRCGAESGWVPVSAISPSILVSEIEVEKKAKEQDRPPVLPPPDSKGAPAVAEDALMKAMDDELRRSLKKLKMEKLERPYYLEYTIKDVEAIFVQASFGAITRSDEGRDRYLNVDLRVGDYHFDNTNYAAGGSGFSFGGRPAAMVTDNDYDALRHQLWLATDNAYKSALEAISRKRAYVKTRRFEEMLDDMCRVKSYTSIQHRAKLTTSKEVWDERVARISEMFRKYPTIKESRVSFFAAASNQYFLNSEGSKHLRPGVLYGLEVTATAQAEDGMELSDFVTFYSRSGEGPAPLSEIEKSVRAMASSLEKKAKAPTIDDYTGPVLFVGQASGEFFQQLLGKNVSNPRKPMMENEMLQAVVPGGRLTGKLGKRVLPRFVDVSDDPGLKEWEGKELIGQYLVDDDGVPARGVQIVDDGKLVGLLMSRIPTRKVQESNGHGRAEGAYVVGRISNMIVESERAKSADDLLEEFKSMCKDFDLDYGIIVEKMSLPRFAKKRRSMSYLFRQRQEQGSFLCDPVTVYKVDLKTGKKELVRGCQFSGVTLRMLRDIIDTGGDQYVHNFLSSLVPLASGIPASVVSPSILIEEVELKKVSGEMPKSPILPNPYFD